MLSKNLPDPELIEVGVIEMGLIKIPYAILDAYKAMGFHKLENIFGKERSPACINYYIAIPKWLRTGKDNKDISFGHGGMTYESERGMQYYPGLGMYTICRILPFKWLFDLLEKFFPSMNRPCYLGWDTSHCNNYRPAFVNSSKQIRTEKIRVMIKHSLNSEFVNALPWYKRMFLQGTAKVTYLRNSQESGRPASLSFYPNKD